MNRSDITQAMLVEYLNYNPLTGHLTWKKRPSKKCFIGDRAGSLVTTTGYRSISFLGFSFAEHRLIWCLRHGYWSTKQIDHIDQNRSNNAEHNLREVSISENAQNRKRRKETLVGEAGIWYNKKRHRYVAEITMTVSGTKKKVYQQSFVDADEAVAARKAKLIELGFHENHGS